MESWINICLNSAMVSVLVNEIPTSEFKMEKGLRQEGFNVLMRKVVELGHFKGFKFDSYDDQIYHIQFFYDTIIIGKKSWENVRTLKVILKLF